MQSPPSGRRAIPRPWLSRKVTTDDAHLTGTEPTLSSTVLDLDLDEASVWDKPNWTVSLGKLRSCFCVRKEPEAPKMLQDSTGSFHQDANFPKQRVGSGDQSDGSLSLFANYPGHLTNSMRSRSFGSRGASWNHGSMSSFSLSDSDSTMSESSSSSSDVVRPTAPPRRHKHARSSSFACDATPSRNPAGSASLSVVDRPPPPPRMPHNYNTINVSNSSLTAGKPPMISHRHTSLPPRKVSSTSPPRASKHAPPPVRGRCDTDYSKLSSATNGSRHRRMNQHFSFCDNSMDDVWNKQQHHQRNNSFAFSDDMSSTGVPLSMILCPESQCPARLGELDRDQSGYISPMEDEYDDDDASLDMSGFDFDISQDHAGDEDDEDDLFGVRDSRNDADSYSPFANLDRKVASDNWMKDWAAAGPVTPSPDKAGSMTVSRAASAHVVTPRSDELVPTQRRTKPKTKPVAAERVSASEPVYLRKNSDIDGLFGNCVRLSGWVAVTFGDDDMADRLKRRRSLTPNNMYYLCVTEEADSRVVLYFSDDFGNVLHTLECEPGWRCESREISGQVGRCVFLRNYQGATLASLLPVSLPDCFFSSSSGNLVSEKKFLRLRDRLFAVDPTSERTYAPDSQHDAAMHVLFSLDALLNKTRRFY